MPTSKPIDPTALLDGLDRDILRTQIAEAEARLAALRILERALAARNGELPPKKPRKPAARTPNRCTPGAPLEARIIRYLEHNQPAKPALLAAELVAPQSTITAILDGRPEKFEKTPLGWRLRTDD